ncbi:MAG: hypothetical protein KF773_00190 [Deltaproteobacteria bacterium]|nr:hypothetical protein [Deltaproteobacteria bacterium]
MIRMLFASVVFAAACSGSAQADQVFIGPAGPPGVPVGSQIALQVAPAKQRAPYDVQVIREGGGQLPTFAHKDRFYVQGNASERYIIRVTNPTPRRVEAVVSVDGLDVIDGDAGDLRKRGYVVPPYGDVRIEGFRTSTEGVATFRFSSVDDSYAGKKGAARNVGVIAVAIFEEVAPQPEPQIIIGAAGQPAPRDGRKYDYTDDLDTTSVGPARGNYRVGGAADAGESVAKRSVDKDAKAEAARPSDRPAAAPAKRRYEPAPTVTSSRPATGAVAPMPPPPPPPHRFDEGGDGDYDAPVVQSNSASRTNRPGLGTEFGEHRYSAASYTRFVRNGAAPIAIAELRYNNQAGLMALGILAQPLPDAGELMTRETADPFPGDHRFATRPR